MNSNCDQFLRQYNFANYHLSNTLELRYIFDNIYCLQCLKEIHILECYDVLTGKVTDVSEDRRLRLHTT